MERWDNARELWDRDFRETTTRGNAAIVALAATATLRIVKLVTAMMTTTLIVPIALLELVLLVVTAVLFLRWLARAVSLSAIISATRSRWTSSGAVWSFFIPFVSLWRPYQIIRDLHDQLAPDGVPEPAPRMLHDGSAGYRDGPLQKAPPPRTLPHASIGAWWALFIVSRILGDNRAMGTEYAAIVDVLALIGAVLAVFVVRAIDARMAERFRRVRHASDEELEAWQIRA